MIFTIDTSVLQKDEIIRLLGLKNKELNSILAEYTEGEETPPSEYNNDTKEIEKIKYMIAQITEAYRVINTASGDIDVNEVLERVLSVNY